MDTEKLTITHANVNQAPKMRRRTYRAHGRINAYMSCPAHINLIAEVVDEDVKKTEEKKANEEAANAAAERAAPKTKKQAAQLKYRTGGVKKGGGV